MSFERYISPLDLGKLIIPPKVKLTEGLWCTQLPIQDPEVGFAHFTPSGAAYLAKLIGGRLPKPSEVLLMHQVASEAGTEIEVFTMPDAHYRSLGYKPGAPEMSSKEWMTYSDAEYMRRIKALVSAGPECQYPVSNVGKLWTDPPGSLCGGWVPEVGLYDPHRHGPGFIQQGSGTVIHGPGKVINGFQTQTAMRLYDSYSSYV